MPPLRLCLEWRVSLPILACHLCTWHTMPGNLKAAMQVGTAISNMRPSANEGSISQKTFFNPCLLRFDLRPGTGAMIIASTQPRDAGIGGRVSPSRNLPRVSIVRHAPMKDAFVESLTTAADQFIVARGKQKRSPPVITGSAIRAQTP